MAVRMMNGARQKIKPRALQDKTAQIDQTPSFIHRFTMSNPYSVPAVTDEILQADDPQGFRIIGNQLVCSKTAALPEICIVTGTTTDLVRIQRKLVWSPRWLLLVLLISPILLLLIYLLVRRRCDVSWSMSRKLVRKLWGRFFLGLGGVLIGMPAGFIFSSAIGFYHIAFYSMLAMIVGGIILMLLSGYPLRVERQQGGKIFWLTGYSMHFIKAVNQTLPATTAG